MPYFINLRKNGLRRSPRLNKEKSVHENGDLVCSKFTCINNKTESMLNKPKTIVQCTLHTLEQVKVLLDNTTNHVSEFALKIVDNEVFTCKDMMRLPDQNDFIQVM